MANPGVPGTPGVTGPGEVILAFMLEFGIIEGPAMDAVSIGVVTLLLLAMKLFILPKGPDGEPTPGLWTGIS
jgi:hypothetical protein